MKIALYLFLFQFIAISIGFSQDSIIHIEKVPTEGILLDKGWKFHAGDDSKWINPDFNDRDWESIDPAVDITQIPQFETSTIGWLRLRVSIDSSVASQPLSLIVTQVGASEIYL